MDNVTTLVRDLINATNHACSMQVLRRDGDRITVRLRDRLAPVGRNLHMRLEEENEVVLEMHDQAKQRSYQWVAAYAPNLVRDFLSAHYPEVGA